MLLITLSATLAAAQSQPATPASAEPVQPATPVSFKITHVEASKPQIVRIFNLDEGPREIVLPPAPVLLSDLADPPRSEKSHSDAGKPQTVVIFNLGEGTREIELSPQPK